MSIIIKNVDMPKFGDRTFKVNADGSVIVMDNAWTQIIYLENAAKEIEVDE